MMTGLGVAGSAAVMAAVVILAGRAIEGELREERARWLVVERDRAYTTSLDTARIVSVSRRTYEIWYRTDHTSPRYYRGKAFTRETVHAILRCNDYSFRVISTTMSMGSGRSVVHQEMTGRDLQREGWHSVEPESPDEKAALATCEVSDSKSWLRR